MRGFLTISVAALGFLSLASAQTPAVTAFAGGATFGSVDGTDMTVGWRFTPTANVTVSALGVWDNDTSTPFAATHQVGLWNSSGTLLASATVQTNGPATGSWRYASISPITLTSGQTYYIGSAITSPYTDVYTRAPASGGSVTSNSLITVGASVTNASAGGFSFPSTVDATYLGRFGPNLLVSAPAPATVPVSTSTVIFLAAALTLSGAFLIWRRRPAQTV